MRNYARRNEVEQPKKNEVDVRWRVRRVLSLSLSLSLFLSLSFSLSLFLFISLYCLVWMSCLVVKMTGVHSEIVGNRGSVRREVLLRQVRCSLLRTPLPTDFRSALWIGREQWGWNAIYSHSTPVETRERVPFAVVPDITVAITDLRILCLISSLLIIVKHNCVWFSVTFEKL